MINIHKTKDELINIFNTQELTYDNAKYGEFLIQTNKLKWYLALVIIMKLSRTTKEIKRHLERLSLGSLIKLFDENARTAPEIEILGSLKIYKDSRDFLAQKMFTTDKINIKECEIALQLGSLIIFSLENILKPLKDHRSVSPTEKN
jgi:hypothetical protein